MKAVMKVALGVGNVEVREIEDPSPPAGHIKLEVMAAGICGTDIHIYHDEFRTTPPVVLGHEVAGVIAELGKGFRACRWAIESRPRPTFPLAENADSALGTAPICAPSGNLSAPPSTAASLDT